MASIQNSNGEQNTAPSLDEDKISRLFNDFSASLDILEKDLHTALVARSIPTLNTSEQVKVDTYLAYLNSTMYWMHLKLQGTDVSNHYILHDLSRAKDMLAREKELDDFKKTPRLDMPATKRFIAAGTHKWLDNKDAEKKTK